MDSAELAFAGIARQAELIRSKEISSRELVQVYLDRIARLDPQLNSFRVVLEERALLEADQADGRAGSGDDRPLLGVPVAIKDGWDVAGEFTTHGTGAYGPAKTEDCEFVRRLRDAGAVIIGKTLQPELALWMFTETSTWGVTRNPWNPDHVPGGSSGGSGAAVAAGLVGAASASDGAGSIRIPAAACGLFGLKPQRGRVPMWPYNDHWHGLSVAGCVSRSVADTALWLDVVGGASDRDPASAIAPPAEPLSAVAQRPPGQLRVAMSFASPTHAPVAAETRKAVEEMAAAMEGLGHRVTPRDPDYGSRLGGLSSDVGLSLSLRFLHGGAEDADAMARPGKLMRRTKQVQFMGHLIPDDFLARDRAKEAAIAARVNQVFDDHDVLMTPTVGSPPIEVGRFEGRGALATIYTGLRGFGAAFTGTWNVCGNPAASVPAGIGEDGLPLAVQLIGRPGDEATLVSLAAQLEAERPWAQRLPAVS
ncbi:MAG: amidase [Thermoleophilaceae bacterium]|nr:amidase [Thermoleophilaceae bacterium]